ncbi:hypothetical protein BKA62DRAFT_723875 [Auriculariales sp. MPI-PUGE-AT-0066]|nr:hypothetical protein BKA62DRAFT_723875 [Auriculariales sp. MPI-PUGE-AT-0066]
MIALNVLLFAFVTIGAHAKLLVDYTGGEPVSRLGVTDMEARSLHQHVLVMTPNTVFIRPENDTTLDMPALHYKRTPQYRRAEVKALHKGEIKPNKKYYIGYTVRLDHAAPGLVMFQWKKQDKYANPKQNIPFHLTFKGADRLALEYTTPGSNGSNRSAIWTGDFKCAPLGFVIDTDDNCGGSLEFWLDGKRELKRGDLCLFTGDTHPKWGIYRGEAQPGSRQAASAHTFNSYVYRVQVSEGNKTEVATSAGW